jgi:hypothetical protein
MTAFLAALRALPDNPILRREWRSLGRELGDWRIWLYLRQPRDARGWALRALLWCSLMPYGVWAVLEALRQWFLPWYARPWHFSPLMLGFALVGLYLSLMCAVVMASSIAQERERDTWELLRITSATGHVLLVGLLFGRLAPLPLGFLLVGLIWDLTRAHYAALVVPLSPMLFGHLEIARVVGTLGLLAVGAGILSMGISAWCRSARTSGVLSVGGVVLWVGGLFWALMERSSPLGEAIFFSGIGVTIVLGYLVALWGLRLNAGRG